MKAAVINSFEAPPIYGDFAEPTLQAGEVLVEVGAAALSPLVKGRASGSHYSSESQLPFVPGVDGIGRTPDGQRVYFVFPRAPYGAMAQRVPARTKLCVPVPDSLDDVTAAAIANPGMSSWAALTRRAHLEAGETVLVNGATGSAGQLAIRIAKHLGAKRVIATGRNAQVLESLLSAGADLTIPLEQDAEGLLAAFRAEVEQGVDVVLDYLWGSSAEQLIKAIASNGSEREGTRLRFVQIGSISGGSITLPSSPLRSTGLELMGSGIGSVSHQQLLASIGELLQAVEPAQLSIETEAVPLTQVETAWNSETGGRRLVFTV